MGRIGRVSQVGRTRRSLSDLSDPLDLPALLDRLSRRVFLSAALLAPAAFSFQRDARLIGTVPLGTPGAAAPPFGRLLGSGLDARLFTDLSTLGQQSTIESAIRTPQSAFFVRTAAPPALPLADTWALTIAGPGAAPTSLRLRDLDSRVGASQRVLLECSGNADQSNYGLMSTADWEGIPIEAVLDRIPPSSGASRVLVSGIDDDTRTWRTSIAGANYGYWSVLATSQEIGF